MNSDNLKPVQSEKEAREKGHNGGINSGRKRRKQREAKDAIRLLLNMDAEGKYKDKLEELHINEHDRTNMCVIVAAMFKKAASGDTAAFRALMEYGGYAPDQELKEQERKARIGALSPEWNKEQGSADVVIYLPAIDDD